MAKMVDIATVSRPIGEEIGAAEKVRQELLNYLGNGWTLFNTHFMGIAGNQLMMAYIFVKYDEDVLTTAAPIVQEYSAVVPRKRGRPAKVVAEG